jgi:AcrR family transcriptional regulator
MEKFDPSLKQQEREELILNVAAEQLLRWGYKKVTINDIAQQAGIGTGTIYLHWKTKETLFHVVMMREMIAVWNELLELIRNDPREIFPHRMMRASLLIVMQRPIARAICTGDSELLGKLAQSKLAVRTKLMVTPDQFVEFLREHGLMRTDMSVHMQQYTLSAIVTGFYIVDPLLAQEDRVSLEERADALAHAIRQTLEPSELLAEDVLREVVAPEMMKFFARINAGISEQLQMSMSL